MLNAAKAGEQWSEIRRPGSISFMQEDKEESQHCASLLVTQHCGVACCPLIVVSLLLLAETLFDWTRRPLRCSGWWTCFWFGFLHIQMDVSAKQNRCVYHFKRSNLKWFLWLATLIWLIAVICLLRSNQIHCISPPEQDLRCVMHYRMVLQNKSNGSCWTEEQVCSLREELWFTLSRLCCFSALESFVWAQK